MRCGMCQRPMVNLIFRNYPAPAHDAPAALLAGGAARARARLRVGRDQQELRAEFGRRRAGLGPDDRPAQSQRVDRDGRRVTDTLPANVVVANPLTIGSNTCGFAVERDVPAATDRAHRRDDPARSAAAIPGQCQLTINVVSTHAQHLPQHHPGERGRLVERHQPAGRAGDAGGLGARRHHRHQGLRAGQRPRQRRASSLMTITLDQSERRAAHRRGVHRHLSGGAVEPDHRHAVRHRDDLRRGRRDRLTPRQPVRPSFR